LSPRPAGCCCFEGVAEGYARRESCHASCCRSAKEI
jgi:hypothetical protein